VFTREICENFRASDFLVKSRNNVEFCYNTNASGWAERFGIIGAAHKIHPKVTLAIDVRRI
jgi:hypothetical protein